MDITHCPECSTAFKVTPEQLALASGWVRCGRCGAVFEAQRHFTPNPLPEAASLITSEQASSKSQDKLFAQDKKADSVSGHAQAVSTRWPTWLALNALLLLLLIWQIVLSQRHVLAAEEPALKPILEALCAPVACEVTWPRELDAVQIENTSFSENLEGGYTLQIRLRNTQHHPVATPYLELNLTDLQDQVVVRRVFSTEEMALSPQMTALRDVRSTLNFDLDAGVSEHVSGFRALIFYP
ncbi:hypothetical protein B9Z39_04335 [Limnohabitans sp. JirII-29]|uniref:zinc-ribbon and DUF3426 domain-containing protein n=1 Tax=Limnohabitans sp. JirII-29 TaxID=1835756 RepID=UPI000D380D5B|nr:zinc-ribbon and DUF3426 domain-containing protein [Limnohabitans sp. JirII-29]PUE29474.1 hypothetical protein B9Z39_04335 [Limnohabitans sp. JirII-29]